MAVVATAAYCGQPQLQPVWGSHHVQGHVQRGKSGLIPQIHPGLIHLHQQQQQHHLHHQKQQQQQQHLHHQKQQQQQQQALDLSLRMRRMLLSGRMPYPVSYHPFTRVPPHIAPAVNLTQKPVDLTTPPPARTTMTSPDEKKQSKTELKTGELEINKYYVL